MMVRLYNAKVILCMSLHVSLVHVTVTHQIASCI